MIRVSAPAKLILMGEHAVVYGAPALVAAIDLRLTVAARPDPAAGGLSVAGRRWSWTQVREHAAQARERWERDGLASHDDPQHLVLVAVGEALRERPDPAQGLELSLESEIPSGSGLGSSAAVAVTVVAATLAATGVEPAPERVARCALEVERRQHGRPSGVDHTTVLRGGVLLAQRADGGALRTRPLSPGAAWRHLFLLDSGQPASSTGEAVAQVREARRDDPAAIEDTMTRMREHTEALVRLLERGGALGSALAPVRGFQRELERLGVVPDGVRSLVRRVERAGGAAKVCGAGAVRGDAAGCLLLLHERPAAPEGWDFLPGTPRRVRLGARGLTVESQG